MNGRRFDHVTNGTAPRAEDDLTLLADLLVANVARTLGGSADAESIEWHAYEAALGLWAERRPETGFVAGDALAAVRAAIARRRTPIPAQ